MTRGFTVIEVIVAIVLLEVCVLGVAGMLVLSSRTLTRAEALETAVAVAEGVLDSLRALPAAAPGSRTLDDGTLEWTIGPADEVVVRARGLDGTSWFTLHARTRPR